MMKKEDTIYEEAIKCEDGKYHITGHTRRKVIDHFEKWCIKTMKKGNYTYKTYKYDNGEIEQVRYWYFD